MEGNEAIVSVRDNGIGIGKPDIKKLFVPFFRAKDPGESGVEGTGLGLSIAKGIIESHGGRIWIKSVKGKGTTAYFSLPVKLK
jgi:signal transduction histidine kinase